MLSTVCRTYAILANEAHILACLILSNLLQRIQHIIRLSQTALPCLTYFLPLAAADDRAAEGPGPGPIVPYNGSVPHLTKPDHYRGNAQTTFSVVNWIRRGVKIRYGGNDELCYDSLIATIDSLIVIRAAEYNGAAGTLALLPTVGALLGAPTNEIWRLWTVIPLGGVLTMMLSFGGAILPIKIEDYERDIAKGNGLIGSIVSFRAPMHGERPMGTAEKVAKLNERLRKRLGQTLPQPSIHGTLIFGLLGMATLLAGAHGSMAMVEQGAILPWYCVCRWWMHLWYILVTIIAMVENWSNLPFEKQWQLFISDVPYRVEIEGGDDIMSQLQSHEDSISRSLHRLSRLRAGRVIMKGSRVHTNAVNTVMVMISMVAKDNHLDSVIRLCTKMSSIGVFVTGTAFFASAQLLALPMAVMVITFILAAGVFGRGFANWIVTRIDREEPMIHVIVKDPREAHDVIAGILGLDDQSPLQTSDQQDGDGDKSGRQVQVEIEGHVFIKKRRVGHRSPLHVKVKGILAKPFDVRSVAEDRLDYDDTKYEPSQFAKMSTSYTSASPASYHMVPVGAPPGPPPSQTLGPEIV